jgi:hypothetical protein
LTHVTATSHSLSQSESAVTRTVAELVFLVFGGACVIVAIGANQRWLDRHFLPSFLLPRDWFTLIETSVRVGLALLGAWLMTRARKRVGRMAGRDPALALSIGLAILLAFGAAEIALTRVKVQPAEWLFPDEEPRRQIDAHLGWTYAPSRIGHKTIGGRVITYAIDAHGYRVRTIEEPVDPARPSVLFAGESVMAGEGLTWDESVPGQVAHILQTQSVNLAVDGYSSDQAYLRLERELPQFRRPVAVVMLFMTALFGRNLDRDRPYLDSDLTWRPARPRSRLLALAQIFIPYRSDAAVENGVRNTRDVLAATAALATRRGALPVILVPQFGHDDQRDQELRHAIFDGSGVTYVFVELDPAWRIPWDRHPDARAARAMADAVARAIRR